MKELKELKVGDKIRVQNFMNDYVVEIERVTKTQAIARTPFNNTMKFRKAYNPDSKYAHPIHSERFSTTTYTIL